MIVSGLHAPAKLFPPAVGVERLRPNVDAVDVPGAGATRQNEGGLQEGPGFVIVMMMKIIEKISPIIPRTFPAVASPAPA